MQGRKRTQARRSAADLEALPYAGQDFAEWHALRVSAMNAASPSTLVSCFIVRPFRVGTMSGVAIGFSTNVAAGTAGTLKLFQQPIDRNSHHATRIL
jgi:hypothetical protein